MDNPSSIVIVVLGVVAVLAAAYAGWLRRQLTSSLRQLAALGGERAREQQAAAHREQLLRAIVENAPSALLVFAQTGAITFTNTAARELFFDGAQVEGQNFLFMVERAPEPLRRALLAEGDELFTVDAEGASETFHVSRRYLDNGGTLVAAKQMTHEVARQELATLKKVIRVMGHEIGNSLTPITSLVGSARLIVQQGQRLERLENIFATVEERAAHLSSFLEGYARLARIPEPRREVVAWAPFLGGLRTLWPEVNVAAVADRPGFFDPAQIQQVLINLVKNAREAAAAGTSVLVELAVEAPPEGGIRFVVLDNGAGMSEQTMESALLPFFTTKPNGSGLGLALCREIVEQHRGRLRLARRPTGGMAVSFWLPDRAGTPSAALAQSRVRLSLTQA
jgi:two-component system, NtrC family, nitrogen regulation sensor histidine kinase NtrY